MDAYREIILLLAATIRVATPLVLASMAGLFSERAGIVALGLEGKMLAGAFAAGSIAALTGSAWAGLGAAMLTGIAVALFLSQAQEKALTEAWEALRRPSILP